MDVHTKPRLAHGVEFLTSMGRTVGVRTLEPEEMVAYDSRRRTTP